LNEEAEANNIGKLGKGKHSSTKDLRGDTLKTEHPAHKGVGQFQQASKYKLEGGIARGGVKSHSIGERWTGMLD